MKSITCIAVVAMLTASSVAEAQHYKAFAGRAIIDTATQAVLVNNCPSGVTRYALNPDGSETYALWGVPLRLNPAQCFLNHELPTPGFSNMVIAPSGRDLYFIDGALNVTASFDTFRNRFAWGPPTGFPFRPVLDDLHGLMIQSPYPGAMVISPDGQWIYLNATSDPENRLAKISTATLTAEVAATNTEMNSGLASGMALLWDSTPFERRLYATNGRGSIAAFNAVTLELVAEIPVSANPVAIAVNPKTKRAYVGHFTSADVEVIDLTTNTVMTTIQMPAGEGAYSMALTPDGRFLYVARQASPVVVIDTETNTVSAAIATGGPVFDIAITRLALNEFHAEATLQRDRTTFNGSFVLGEDANGFDLATEDLALSIGRRTIWIEAGSWTPDPNLAGVFRFQGPIETSLGVTYLRMTLRPGDGPGEYRIDATTETMNPGTDDFGDPDAFQAVLVIGDDGGIAELDMTSQFEETISALEADLAAAQTHISALNAQNTALVDENVRLTSENARLSTDAAALSAANTELATQLAAANEMLARERTRIALLRERVLALVARNDAQHETIVSLRALIDELLARIERLRQ